MYSLLSIKKKEIELSKKNLAVRTPYDWESHPTDFAANTVPNWKTYAHQQMFGDIFKEAVEEAEADPLNITHRIITCPPQIGKSYFFSCPAPLWYLNKYPDRSVLYLSHTYSLSEDFVWQSRDVASLNQDYLNVQINTSSRAKGKWHTTKGGFMMGAGKGTAIPGRPGHLVIVDDLYSSEEEAYSRRQLEKIERWWDTSVVSRKQKWTLIIFIITRWNKNDLIGTLLKRMEKSQKASKYKLYNFPALTTEQNYKTDPLGRQPGQSICEDRFPASYYESLRDSINPFHFEALWQGNPSDDRGKVFKRSYFQYCQERDRKLYFTPLKGEPFCIDHTSLTFFQVTDTNLKDGEKNDHHVTMTLALSQDGILIIYDVFREKCQGEETLAKIQQQRDKHSYLHECYIVKNFVEDKGAGTVAIQQAEKRADKFLLTPLKAVKSKRERAIPLMELYQAFKVFHLSGSSWLKEFEDEMILFSGEPDGVDDQVDCATYAGMIAMNKEDYGIDPQGGVLFLGEAPDTTYRDRAFNRHIEEEDFGFFGNY